jgi:hypothetical protein
VATLIEIAKSLSRLLENRAALIVHLELAVAIPGAISVQRRCPFVNRTGFIGGSIP